MFPDDYKELEETINDLCKLGFMTSDATADSECSICQS